MQLLSLRTESAPAVLDSALQNLHSLYQSRIVITLTPRLVAGTVVVTRLLGLILSMFPFLMYLAAEDDRLKRSSLGFNLDYNWGSL